MRDLARDLHDSAGVKKYRPMYDRLLVEVVSSREVKTASGVVGITISESDLVEGRVIAAGEGEVLPVTGELRRLRVGVGDVILFRRYEAVLLDNDALLPAGVDLYIVGERNVHAVDEGGIEVSASPTN